MINYLLCESSCYICHGKFLLRREREGVALCLKCRIKNWITRKLLKIELS